MKCFPLLSVSFDLIFRPPPVAASATINSHPQNSCVSGAVYLHCAPVPIVAHGAESSNKNIHSILCVR